MNFKEYDLNTLTTKSQKYRLELFDMCMNAKRGHFPSASALVELTSSLYNVIMNHDPQNIKWENRDRLIISEGHAAIVQYPLLSEHGYFPKDELSLFAMSKGILRQYPDNSIPGIECATGSLGHGLGIGSGFALDAKRKGRDYMTYVVISDGEYWEGSIEESARFAAHYNLNNLVCILNHNGLSILGETEKLLRQEPLEDKWKSDGWFVQRINGHSYTQIINSIKEIGAMNYSRGNEFGRPSVIIADTVKGKGIKEMESKHRWHNSFPKSEEDTKRFREELIKYNSIGN